MNKVPNPNVGGSNITKSESSTAVRLVISGCFQLGHSFVEIKRLQDSDALGNLSQNEID